MPAQQPQDRLPKKSAAKKAPARKAPAKRPSTNGHKNSGAYTFFHDSKRYTLPGSGEVASVIGKEEGGFLMDIALATTDQEQNWAELRMGFAVLNACKVDQETLRALRSKPSTEMIEIIGDWMNHAQGAAVSAGESSDSPS